MGQRVPAVVGLYFREAGQWRRIAEFRLAPEGHVTFRAVDPVEGLVARVWYHQGVDILGENRTVRPDDGPAFLRALLQPFGFRDYWFRDDSSPRSGFTRVRHGVSRGAPATGPVEGEKDEGEKDWAAADSGCGDGDGVEPAPAEPAPRTTARPAAWRVLDGDTIRF